MKKLLLISMLIGAMPLAMMAQDDDLYFVAKKKKASKIEQVKEYAPVVAPQPKAKSSYEVIDGDTTKLDVIDFAEVKGVYPTDTLETEDYALTKKMMRFDDYDVSSNAAFWAGYNAGRSTWLTWHSPWYYSRYGLYEPWYNSYWYNYYSPWYYSWYDPWYYGWYDPYYSSWGWPYYGYYSWYSPYWHGGYYHPYYYGGGGGGSHHYYGHTGNAGTIDVKGSTGNYRPAHRNTVTNNSQRMGSLRERASSMSGGRVYTSGNTERVGRRTANRGNTVYSTTGNNSSISGNRSTYSGSSSSNRSNGSYSSGGSRSSSSNGGGFSSGGSRSSGGGGGTRSSGGGGGSHMGGRR